MFRLDRGKTAHTSGNASLVTGKTDDYRRFIPCQFGWNVIDHVEEFTGPAVVKFLGGDLPAIREDIERAFAVTATGA